MIVTPNPKSLKEEDDLLKNVKGSVTRRPGKVTDWLPGEARLVTVNGVNTAQYKTGVEFGLTKLSTLCEAGTSEEKSQVVSCPVLV